MDKSISQVIARTGVSSVICFLLVLLTGIITVGCGGPRVYIHPSPGLDRIKTVAVMPFENLSKDGKAAEKVRSGFVLELLRTGNLSVIDINEMDRILKGAGLSYGVSQMPAVGSGALQEEIAVDSTPLSKKIGDALKVQAIVVGSVQTHTVERTSDRVSPEVSITARLIDTETGIIIWASTHTRRGGMGIPILGWGKITSLSMLSQHVIQDMIDSLAEYIPEG